MRVCLSFTMKNLISMVENLHAHGKRSLQLKESSIVLLVKKNVPYFSFSYEPLDSKAQIPNMQFK